MKVRIPTPLRSYTGGAANVTAEGATVDELFVDLDRRFPGLRFRVIDEQGRKRRWLAERVGVSEAYLSLIIAGSRTVDRALGERIGALLGVPFFLLFEIAE